MKSLKFLGNVHRSCFHHEQLVVKKCTRHLSSSSSLFKYSKATVEAVIQWNVENETLYGAKTKPAQNNEKADGATANGETVKRKRGRPKKIKEVEDPNEHEDPTIKAKTTNNIPVKAPVDVIPPSTVNYLEAEPVTVTEPAKIDGVLYFPLFPPDRTEFYVNPPVMPEIYIPGHSERANFENPFFPSVGTVLGGTLPVESRVALKKWKDNLVTELGEEGFKKVKKETLDRGKSFHSLVEQLLQGVAPEDVTVTPPNEGYFQSARQAMKNISDVLSVEQTVIHRNLCYKGQFDCIARFRDELVLIDWKTSKKTKSDIRYTYDNPLQVAAYVGAHNFSTTAGTMIDRALIVVCYEDGQPAHTHLLSRGMLVDYWGRWLARLHQYWQQKTQGEPTPPEI